MYTYTYTHIYMYRYIYIYTDRQTDRHKKISPQPCAAARFRPEEPTLRRRAFRAAGQSNRRCLSIMDIYVYMYAVYILLCIYVKKWIFMYI